MDRHEIIASIHQHQLDSERFGVRALALHGPAARDMAAERETVDVLVEFEDVPTFDAYMGLKRFLERLLHHRIDLSTPESLDPDTMGDAMASGIHVIGEVGERAEAARRADGAPPPRPLRDRVIELLATHQAELAGRGVRSIWLFGSVARGDPGPHSDVDVLVDLAPEVSLFELIGIKHYLEDHFHRPVDVIPHDGLREQLRSPVLAEAIHIWTAQADHPVGGGNLGGYGGNGVGG